MSHNKSRFRITTWPGTVLPTPLVQVRDVGLDEHGWVRYGDKVNERRDLEPELSIRELQQLDLTSGEAVVDFVRRHGVIARTAADSGLGTVPASAPPAPEHHPSAAHVHWTDIAAHLAVARVLALHVLYHLADKREAAAWEETGFFRPDFHTPAEDEHAWAEFQNLLHVGLKHFHARVEIEWLASSEVGHQYVTGLKEVGLFSVLCVQTLNLLTEGLPARRCAKESCGMWFVRQAGRAEHGQHRTEGVIYCSKSCAKAQAQSEYRRRNRKGNGQ